MSMKRRGNELFGASPQVARRNRSRREISIYPSSVSLVRPLRPRIESAKFVALPTINNRTCLKRGRGYLLLELIFDANPPPVTQCKGSTFASPFHISPSSFLGGRTYGSSRLLLPPFCASKGWLVLVGRGLPPYIHTLNAGGRVMRLQHSP